MNQNKVIDRLGLDLVAFVIQFAIIPAVGSNAALSDIKSLQTKRAASLPLLKFYML